MRCANDDQFIAPVDSVQHARSVREDTAELADYLLSNGSSGRRSSVLQRSRGSIHDVFNADAVELGSAIEEVNLSTDTIPELPEPVSPDLEPSPDDGPSVIANMLKRSPPQSGVVPVITTRRPTIVKIDPQPSQQAEQAVVEDRDDFIPNERTSLLHGPSLDRPVHEQADVEGQKKHKKPWLRRLIDKGYRAESKVAHAVAVAVNPTRWDRKAVWKNAVADPVSCLPAVAVGLLLNILDALSYGMILFPLGNPIFANLGSAGISIYYVSTIVSQLVFSTGSIFKGAVGSELVRLAVLIRLITLV